MLSRNTIPLLLALLSLSGGPSQANPEGAPDTRRTHVFSRAQLKFGLQPDDYLNRYLDRPLFLDPVELDPFVKLQHEVHIAHRYGLDGLAFFPQNTGAQLYHYAKRLNAPEFFLLTELAPTAKPVDEKLDLAEAARQLPTTFRLNGKVLISSYVADHRDPQYWKEFMDGLRERHGDHFLFLPTVTNFGKLGLHEWMLKFRNGEITESDLKPAREMLRSWLRATDGLYFSEVTDLRDDQRRLDTAFYRDFLIPLFRSVLSEPEFKGKIFGLAAKVGHENHGLVGRTLSSDGTRTLRHSFEAAMEAKPDIINIPEWDELNESTCLMPTIFDGTSQQRILRYYMSKIKGEPLQPLPDDQEAFPNLILSHRGVLTLGEELEIELLHLPDTIREEALSVHVILLDRSGKALYRSEALPFSGKELLEHRLTIPTLPLAHQRVLRPRLEVIREGQKPLIIESGLPFIELNPWSNRHYKWNKTPVRDLLKANDQHLSLARTPEGLVATGRFETEEPLAWLELVENDNVIYSVDLHGPMWRENEKEVVLSLAWKSADHYRKPQKLSGSFSLTGATGKWLFPSQKGFEEGRVFQATQIPLEERVADLARQRVVIALPAKEAPDAKLRVHLEGIIDQEFPIPEILKKEAIAIPGPHNLTLVISRWVRQARLPRYLDRNRADFSVRIAPESRDSLFQLRAIAKSGRIYRSKPIALKEGEPLAAEKPTLPGEETRVIDYRFDASHGAFLVTPAGRAFWGVLGGYSLMALERGDSPTNGVPFLDDAHPALEEKTAPDWISTPEGSALSFNGKSTFVVLPQGVVPRLSGFEITMEVKPDSVEGKQSLLANFFTRFGTFDLYMEDGALKIDFLHDLKDHATRKQTDLDPCLELREGEWSTLTLRYDQKVFLLSINGVQGEPIAVEGPGMHDTITTLGGHGDRWFAGSIRSLKITRFRPAP